MHEAQALYRRLGLVPSGPHKGWEFATCPRSRDRGLRDSRPRPGLTTVELRSACPEPPKESRAASVPATLTRARSWFDPTPRAQHRALSGIGTPVGPACNNRSVQKGGWVSNTRYELGHEPDELERLTVQGRALAAPTRALLEAAGLRDGMRVLDLGSGVGDASFVVADIVGDAGEVVGIDRAPEAVAEATARAERLGRANVRFVLRDIHDPVEDGAFDAAVCRLVLMFVPDPSAVLRTQAAAVRPGGIVAPIEPDISRAGHNSANPAGKSGGGLGHGSVRAVRNGDSARPPPVAGPRASRADADRDANDATVLRSRRSDESRTASRHRPNPATGSRAHRSRSRRRG
jgi:SAM-dependent methyltransferase